MAITRITKGVIKPNENYDTHNINSTGIVTAIGLDVNGNGDISGNLSVGGVLTYEDVTSVDSVGIITAQKDIHVGAGISVVGVVTATSFVGSGAALTGIDATSIKDSGGNVKVQAQASGAIHSGVSTFQDIDVDGHTNLDNVSIAGISTATGGSFFGDIQAGVGTLGATIQKTNNTSLYLQYGKPGNVSLCLGGGTVVAHNNFNVAGFSTITGGAELGRLRVGYGNYYLTVQPRSGENTLHLNYDNGTLTKIGSGQTKSDLEVNGDVYPKASGNRNLGLSTKKWINVYANTFVGNGDFVDLDVDGHTNLDNVSIAGITTTTEVINIDADNKKLQIGASQDLQLFHDGGHSRITNTTGILKLTAPSGSSVRMVKPDDSGNVAVFHIDAETHLYYNGAHKFSTISDGIQVVGNATINDSIIHNGDTNTKIRFPADDTISFETAGAERYRVNSSGQVLIGTTTAPAYINRRLTVAQGSSGNNTVAIEVRSPTNGDGRIIFTDSTSSGNTGAYKGQIRYDQTNDFMSFNTNGDNERLRIDSNGAVMIRTTTAGAHSSDLTIGGTTGAGRIMIRSANNGGGYINFQDTTGSTVDGSIEYNHILNSFNFYFESQERFRIHTQGMLGLSGANYGTSGQVLTSGGTGSPVSWTTVSGTTINNNADNRIITGSGTANTLEGEAGLTYNGSMLNVNSVTSENNAFRIYNTTDNSVRYQINGEGNSFIGHTYPRADASIDLGFHTGYRWRDVVLSGGIRFGSSSADDYLDDYEEGTFTPTINVGSYTTFLTNRYIKIGRLVHLHGGLIFNNNSSGTRVEISNIPFAQQSGGQYVGNVWLRRTSTGERNWNMILGEAGTNVLGIFRDSNGGHSDMGGHLSYSDFGSSATYFNYSITYISAS